MKCTRAEDEEHHISLFRITRICNETELRAGLYKEGRTNTRLEANLNLFPISKTQYQTRLAFDSEVLKQTVSIELPTTASDIILPA